MNGNETIRVEHPLERNGTSQPDRFTDALSPGQVPLDDRSFCDLLVQVHAAAGQLSFFDASNARHGTWQQLLNPHAVFRLAAEVKSMLGGVGENQELEESLHLALNEARTEGDLKLAPGLLLKRTDGKQAPHMALLIAFLALYRSSQYKLNDLTRKHLDFYFRDVLRLDPFKPVPDTVHVLFELSKSTQGHKLKAGTRLHAGKDESDVLRRYELTDDVVLSKAAVASLRNLYLQNEPRVLRAGSVADSSDGKGGKFKAGDTRWPLFGSPAYDPAEIGFALSAPVLRSTGGKKTIKLTLTPPRTQFSGIIQAVKAFGEDHPDVFESKQDPDREKGEVLTLSNSWNGWVSGAGDWIELKQVKVEFYTAANSLVFTANPLEEDQSIVDFDSDNLEGNYSPDAPLLRFQLKQKKRFYPLTVFSDIDLQSVKLELVVEKDRDLILQNDLGTINPSKPFQPFGPRPVVGSRFWIGSSFAFQKTLSEFTIVLNWLNLPAQLKDSKKGPYKPYLEHQSLDSDQDENGHVFFHASLHYLKDGKWEPVAAKLDIVTDNPASFDLDLGKHSANSEVEEVTVYYPLLKRGFVRLQLDNPSFAFGHALYPALLTKAVMAVTEKSPLVAPDEPYTPTLDSVSIDYTAGSSDLTFYHLEPFGWVEREIDESPSLLPRYTDEGQLNIGLKDAKPGETVSLLFQLAEGSGDPTLRRPEEMSWEYLAGEKWEKLSKKQLVKNTTLGLTRSGIIAVAIPSDATLEHKRMPRNSAWIRARVKHNSAALSQAFKINAQAAQARFVDVKNSQRHYDAPLPPKSIKKLLQKLPSIKSVSQPYPSFGGRPSESGRHYYRRVSERLRHRDRAITVWDYERLVLQEFPEIHKIKCLSHASRNSVRSPGSVFLIALPHTQRKHALDPYRPAVSQDTLAAVKKFVKGRCSPFVRIEVANPRYEAIRVEAEVVFRTPDDGLNEAQLSQDLKDYFSPWLRDSNRAELDFGGTLYRSAVINFVEERSYVDFLLGLKLHVIMEDGTTYLDQPVIEASTPYSILVTAPDHLISAMKHEHPVN